MSSITADQIDDFDSGFDDEEGGLSGFYVLAIFLGILAAFLVIVYFAYQKGLQTGAAEDALPMVAADPRPVREEVDVALGTAPQRDEVYDRLEGVSPTTVIAEANPTSDPMEGFETTSSAEPAQPVPDAVIRPVPRSETTTPARPAPTPEPAAPVATPTATAQTAAPATAAPATTVPAPTPSAPSAPAIAGTHVVQVGAFGSDEEAMRFFSTLEGRHGAFVGEKRPDIQRAEVKGKTYHRLRLAPFASKAAAQSYCTELKGKGQDCLVRGV